MTSQGARAIILLDRLSVGGAERHAAQLTRRLPEKGVDIGLVVYLGDGAANFPSNELPAQLVELDQASIFKFDGWRRISAYINDNRIDVVAAVNQRALVVAALTRLLGMHRAAVVCLFHTTVISSLAGLLRLPMFYLATALSDGMIYVSRNQAAHWKRWRLPARRSLAIQNGVDTAYFTPPDPAQKRAARQALGVQDDELALSLCARFAPEKNQRQLVEAAAQLKDRGMKLKLLFIGGGPLRGEVERLAAELGVADLCVFCGEHKDVRPYLRAADVCVLVSTSIETFSLAALEGMATGLAAVLSDIGGASEMVADDRNGFLFPAGDTAALVEAIWRLREPGLAARMGQAARERVTAEFAIDRMIGDYANVLPSFARRAAAKPAVALEGAAR